MHVLAQRILKRFDQKFDHREIANWTGSKLLISNQILILFLTRSVYSMPDHIKLAIIWYVLLLVLIFLSR